MLRRKSRSRKSRSHRSGILEKLSFPRAVVMVSITAGAGLWGYALFNVATRSL